MEVKIRSFNAVRARMFGQPYTAMDRLILMRSSPHTHTELQFSKRHDSVSYSATTMDGSNCSRIANIAYSHPERWDTVIVPWTDVEEDYAYQTALARLGTPYDIPGQICHVTKWNIWKPNPKKTWCSKEVATIVLRVTPKRLEEIRKLRNEIMPDQLDMLARYYFSKGTK